jgi:hypothetical protein
MQAVGVTAWRLGWASSALAIAPLAIAPPDVCRTTGNG